MRIERAELVPYALPLEQPYITARGTLERREMVLLRLHTDGGLVGLGEAVPLSLRGGDDLTRVVRRLHRAARRLSPADVSDFGGEDPLRAVRRRTDGPSLNAALAATGALLAAFSALLTGGLLLASV